MSLIHPRFGVWALVQGTWASRFHPEDPPDASWDRNKRLIVEAEALGYDSTLVAQHTINPSGHQLDQLEAWTASAALAAVTERIEIITAIKPYLFHPVVLAKMALQIEEISRGRFAINLVNAWYKPELEKSGIGFAPHDQRYSYGQEWLQVARALMQGERVSFRGQYFQVDDYQLSPKDAFRNRPLIYAGGESEAARNLIAAEADTWFINGQPPDDVRAMISDIRSRPRRGAPLRFGLSAFVIARATDAEAEQALSDAFEIARKDVPLRSGLLANVDPDVIMFKTAAKSPRIGTNGGTSAGLVGSYDTVADRIRHFAALGIDLFMLQFQPVEREMRRFAAEVLPRVRQLEAAE